MTANSINTDPSKPKVKETVVNTKTTDLKAVKEPSKQEKTMNYIIYGVGAGFILLFIGPPLLYNSFYHQEYWLDNNPQ